VRCLPFVVRQFLLVIEEAALRCKRFPLWQRGAVKKLWKIVDIAI
jgi:hypothetical protein